MESSPENNSDTLMSRREFLKYAALCAATAAGFSKAREIESNMPAPPNTDSATQPSLTETVGESLIFNTFQVLASIGLRRLNIPIGNAALKAAAKVEIEKIEQKILEGKESPSLRQSLLGLSIGISYLGLMGPAWEELIFRFIPNVLLNDRTTSKRWEIGVPVSILFAASHNLTKDPDNQKRSFDTHTIPFSQFAAGLFFWKQIREKGIDHAIASHSTLNISALPIAVLGNCLLNKLGLSNKQSSDSARSD